MDKKSVVECLADVMADVRAVRKSERNQAQKFNFRGIDSVVNAVGPSFRKHGIVCVPNVKEHRLESKSTGNGKSVNFVSVNVEYRVFGPSGDSISGVVVAEAFDFGDKATAKAMSVAYRTFLLQTLTLPTDEPDADAESFVESRPDWSGNYMKAREAGRDSFAAFLSWAAKNGGPADMIEAGKKELEGMK